MSSLVMKFLHVNDIPESVKMNKGGLLLGVTDHGNERAKINHALTLRNILSPCWSYYSEDDQ